MLEGLWQPETVGVRPRLLARLLLLGHGGVGRARVGQGRRSPGQEALPELALAKHLLLLFFQTPLFLDKLAGGAPGGFAHGRVPPPELGAHSTRRNSPTKGLTHTSRGVDWYACRARASPRPLVSPNSSQPAAR